MVKHNDSFLPHKHPVITPILEMRHMRHREVKECPKATQHEAAELGLESSQVGSRVRALGPLG